LPKTFDEDNMIEEEIPLAVEATGECKLTLHWGNLSNCGNEKPN